MVRKAVFEGLVFDEQDRQLLVSYVGEEPCYVLDDEGFLRHIPSEQIDRQVLEIFINQIEQNKAAITEQTVKMLGQDDIFTHAFIKNQLENADDQMERLLQYGLPEDSRSYMGMLGFKIVVNYHGDLLRIEQPAVSSEEE